LCIQSNRLLIGIATLCCVYIAPCTPPLTRPPREGHDPEYCKSLRHASSHFADFCLNASHFLDFASGLVAFHCFFCTPPHHILLIFCPATLRFSDYSVSRSHILLSFAFRLMHFAVFLHIGLSQLPDLFSVWRREGLWRPGVKDHIRRPLPP